MPGVDCCAEFEPCGRALTDWSVSDDAVAPYAMNVVFTGARLGITGKNSGQRRIVVARAAQAVSARRGDGTSRDASLLRQPPPPWWADAVALASAMVVLEQQPASSVWSSLQHVLMGVSFIGVLSAVLSSTATSSSPVGDGEDSIPRPIKVP